MITAAVWTSVDIAVESGRDRDNPYLDVRVEAEFLGPSGERISRSAFWDGGRTWRVRFAPTAPGHWSYQITSDDGDASLTSGGDIEAVTGSGGTAIEQHGFLRVADNGAHLAHRDGTPFFWLGDTHWRFAWERWDEANKPGWTSQFRDTVDLRVKQGFTVYQSSIMSFSREWDAPTCWEAGEPFRRLVPAYFRDVLDPRMAYIASRGLVNAVGIGWFQAVDEDPVGLARLAEYLVARYGAAPMVWTVGGEVAGYEPELRQARIDGWRTVAHAIRDADADGYAHPRTVHLTNERPIADYYQDEDWLSFTLNQLGHGDLDMGTGAYRAHLAAHPGRPIVEGESMYEGITTMEPVARRTATSTIVRQVAYRAIQSGCCGYTYGAQGCWNNSWEYGDGATEWGDLPWYDGVDLEGAAQVGYLRRFYESLPWTSLRPAPDLFQTSTGMAERYFPPAVSADSDRRTVVVYFGENFTQYGGAALLTGLRDNAYRVRWFDPRLGEWLPEIDPVTATAGHLTLPQMPRVTADWVLTVTEQES